MILKRCFKLHYWPPLTSAWFVAAFFITYVISVLNGHVYIYFPNISDTGASPPESCIFSQLMNVGAIMFAITMYIRYRQVSMFWKMYELPKVKKWNVGGLWCGICVALGISIVANFQETEIFLVHAFGAFLTFGIGTLFLVVQTIISFAFRHIYKKYPEYGIGPTILYFRAFLSVSSIILANMAGICLLLSLSQFTGEKISWWKEEHGGFQFRLITSFSEWIVAIFFATFLLTMTREYKLMEYEEVRFKSKCKDSCANDESTKV